MPFTILAGSKSYLHILSTHFRRCVAGHVCLKIPYLNFSCFFFMTYHILFWPPLDVIYMRILRFISFLVCACRLWCDVLYGVSSQDTDVLYISNVVATKQYCATCFYRIAASSNICREMRACYEYLNMPITYNVSSYHDILVRHIIYYSVMKPARLIYSQYVSYYIVFLIIFIICFILIHWWCIHDQVLSSSWNTSILWSTIFDHVVISMCNC